MDADTFARERLGWWTPVRTEQVDHALDEGAWDRCASDAPKPEGKTAYGVKFAADGSAACLCGAVLPKDGPARVSLIELQPGGRGHCLAGRMAESAVRPCQLCRHRRTRQCGRTGGQDRGRLEGKKTLSYGLPPGMWSPRPPC